MDFQVKEEGEFKYVEVGEGEKTLLLLHGLFGALSNFASIINKFAPKYKVVVPLLPIFELPLRKASLSGLLTYFDKFVKYKGYDKVHLIGNSLGGHLALMYILQNPEKVLSTTLTGSSGLFESAFGDTVPRRQDYSWIKKRTEETFYDAKLATKDQVDEVYEIVNNRSKAMRLITTAKSAVRNNLGDKLHQITSPVLLVWGKNDIITPPFVGEKFHELLPNSELVMIDKCGHAPMMECPEDFNIHLDQFLTNLEEK